MPLPSCCMKCRGPILRSARSTDLPMCIRLPAGALPLLPLLLLLLLGATSDGSQDKSGGQLGSILTAPNRFLSWSVSRGGGIQMVAAAPEKWSDIFTPYCGWKRTSKNEPEMGWHLWSRPSTWGYKGGIPLGVGPRRGANATIPCGVGVVVDVPNIDLGVLDVRGHLKFLDSPKLRSINLRANFVLVQGRFVIGSKKNPFRQRVTITLTANRRGRRASLKYSMKAPADVANPRNLGHKAFAVVGGVVDIHGMPGHPNTPTWCQLAANALPGSRVLVVDADVKGWGVGSMIAVAPSGFKSDEIDVTRITKISRLSYGRSQIQLANPLRFYHNGKKDVFAQIDIRAEVALLERNVVIQGEKERGSYSNEGGHFIVFRTKAAQFITGVKFFRMGQAGVSGRYPLHFHLSKFSRSVVSKNLIMGSKQRCLVIHGTSHVRVEANVAFDTRGHCFVLEDGDEQWNYFTHNLGMRTRPALKLLPPKPSTKNKVVNETDNKPSTFWISNPRNHFVHNVAAGSTHNGFWVELNNFVRGDAEKGPASVANLVPIRMSFGLLKENVAHSNGAIGFTTYPHGILPSRAFGYNGQLAYNFTFYRNHIGMKMRNSASMFVRRSRFWDNHIGVRMDLNKGVQVQGSIFVGSSRACRSKKREGGRRDFIGVSIGQDFPSAYKAVLPSAITFSKFFRYDRTCHPGASALSLAPATDNGVWNAATGTMGLTFGAGNNRFSVDAGSLTMSGTNQPSAAAFFTLRDMDGSLLGYPGYVVAPFKPILPPDYLKSCEFRRAWRSYACHHTCYRTMQVMFEDVMAEGSQPFSKVVVTRVTDNASYVPLEASPIDPRYQPRQRALRRIPITVLSGHSYRVQILPPPGNPGFYPTKVSVAFMEGVTSCQRGASLLLQPTLRSVEWFLSPELRVSSRPCLGLKSVTRANMVQYGKQCLQGTPTARVDVGGQFHRSVTLVQQRRSNRVCQETFLSNRVCAIPS